MSEPKPFDMTKKEDLERWFREMNGYLRTMDFLKEGTDRTGRRYAYEAFLQLEGQMGMEIPGCHKIIEGYLIIMVGRLAQQPKKKEKLK